ncbi:MAG: DNA polymerase III subunit gamma/tau [Proteobacteria bacterium]|nr:DNA polymerase III subunit gamma/tau [Pseudomonadota bacterium]
MNNRKVLSLKYRPQNFDQLIGQESMAIAIQNAIKMDRIPNAYLLTGIRGVGKTTTARIIAKAINCNKKFGTDEKCSKDEYCHCQAIIDSSHMDILEMDAASKTGIDDIREILDSSQYLPSSAKYKVFIIDEVHMLSKQAFNALLKTLEEPPSHLKFILATTEVKKIPVTILSRCQRFDLRRIKMDEMQTFLRGIAEKENAKIDDKALAIIAKASEGSVRDALSILDQAIITFNLQSQEITEDKVRDMLGLADQTRVIELLSHIVKGSQQEALKEAEDIFNIGADPKLIVQSMLEIIYLISRTKTLGTIENDLSVSEVESAQIKKIADEVDLTYVSMLWHFTLKGIEELNFMPNPFLSFQMLLIRLAHLKNMPDPQSIMQNSDFDDDEEDKEKTENTSEIIKPEGLISKTQIKNTIQEKKEPPKIKPEILNEINTNNSIQSFQDLLDLTNKHKEIELKFDLERNVRLVKFEQGKIDISFNENLSKDFIKNISNKLNEWTGKRWIISLSKDEGETTVYEKKNHQKIELLEQMKQSEIYKKIMATFPDIELIDVKDEGQE